MKRLVKMVFTGAVVACLSQDIIYLSKRMKPAPKVEIVQSAAKPNAKQNLNQLFINFLIYSKCV